MTFHLNIYRHTTAHVHLDNLAQNIQQLRQHLGSDIFFCPMVKANAYGHDDVEVALRIEKEGVKVMGVGLVEEGILLRQMGVHTELLVFGIFAADAVSEILKWKMTPVISTWEQLSLLEHAATAPLKVHLKFDTGMHRLGFVPQDAKKLFEKLSKQKKIIVAGILTHLHSGEDADQENGHSHHQLKQFAAIETVFASMNPISHALNSAGTLNFLKLKKQGKVLSGTNPKLGVRPGLSIYGYSPVSDLPEDIQLKPAMSLRSHVVRYHQLSAGESISYGQTWTSQRPSVIGVVPIGYADGYHRRLSNRGQVLFDGSLVPVVGNVCMDYIMIDVTDATQGRSLQALTEQEVTLFGYDSQGRLLPASDLAKQAQTIPWEILTSVGERVPRIVEGSVIQSMEVKTKKEAQS